MHPNGNAVIRFKVIPIFFTIFSNKHVVDVTGLITDMLPISRRECVVTLIFMYDMFRIYCYRLMVFCCGVSARNHQNILQKFACLGHVHKNKSWPLNGKKLFHVICQSFLRQ